MWVVPLVRGKPAGHKRKDKYFKTEYFISSSSHHHRYESLLSPGDDEEHTADSGAGQQHVHPDVRRQRIEEGEHARVGAVGFAVQDADAQGHEGLGEVDGLLSDVGDGQRGHGEVRDLETPQTQSKCLFYVSNNRTTINIPTANIKP